MGAFKFIPHHWLLLVYKLACMGPVDQINPGLYDLPEAKVIPKGTRLM